MKNIYIVLFCIAISNNSIVAQNLGNNQRDTLLFQSFMQEIDATLGKRLGVKKPFDSTLVDDVLDYITNNQNETKTHFILTRLYRDYPIVYESLSDTIKLNIICYTFTRETKMHYWGHSSRDFAAARMLISLKEKALPCLFSLLNDETPLQFGWDWETQYAAKKYKYRKKDFAYRYAALILGVDYIFLDKPEERDKVIDALTKKYKK